MPNITPHYDAGSEEGLKFEEPGATRVYNSTARGSCALMITTTHTRIIILESLPPEDRRTGSELSNDLQYYRLERRVDIPIEIYKVRGRTDLFQAIESVGAAAESGETPILHVECHGLADRSGLSLSDYTTVAWGEITAPLVRINLATRCNLLLSVAACYGAHSVLAMAQTERAPFWAILAPRDEIAPRDLYGPYLRYYGELLRSGDGDRALAAMTEAGSSQNCYGFITCEQFFMQSYRIHLARSTTESGYQRDVARIRSLFAAEGRDVEELLIRRALEAIDEPLFKELFRRFIMADIYPENAERFRLQYADVQQARATR